ncbi:MAG: triose-phosphate isomerase, partial [Candidatus Marinimicrobia bacterium]|nr:triose-phosphate isomerase [Candidatus Neomarinimicrobiota bacterium]
YARNFKVKGLEKYDVDMLLCPPFTSIAALHELLKDSPVHIGGQTLHQEVKGAYTGEISAEMLLNSGCDYVLIGHSERRQYFGETDESVNTKTKRALDAGILPLVCIGETLEDRQANITNAIIEKQLIGGLKDLSIEQMKKLVIAYEPVWAIGTGLTATPDQAQEVHAFIRTKLSQLFDNTISDSIRLLYGGSAKVENAESLLKQEDIDGLLIGGASLKVDDFTEIIKIAHNL